MTVLDYAYGITQVLLSIAFLCAVYRVFAGPSVLDRVISVDVMLIVVASLLFADMADNDHQDNILFALGTAVIGFLGAVAIARYVAVRSPDDGSDAADDAGTRHAVGASDDVEPEVATGRTEENEVVEAQSPTMDDGGAAAAGPPHGRAAQAGAAENHAGNASGAAADSDAEQEEEESTAWFTALARSRNAPRAEGDASEDPSQQGGEQR